ncbi:hypothetical protein [Kitasatospora cinereorecta]|uniref:Ig-like domain-containing protein n=1 Tax=Kitasatospora cinereorecta TaxID=285560 RepID=A0ABW0V4R2_9ACTN
MASTGWASRLGGAIRTKTAAAVAGGALLVTGAVGAGVWWTTRAPQLQVVQRNTQVVVDPGGRQSTVAGCAAGETALGGGFAIDGAAYATTSEFLGSTAWLAAAYNPGSTSVTLTAYAVCVNAAVEFAPRGEYTRHAYAFRDRFIDKDRAADDGTIDDLTTHGPWVGLSRAYLGTDTCIPGYTMTGMEFRAGRAVAGQPVAPVPLEHLAPPTAPAATLEWTAALDAGTELSPHPHLLHTSDAAERRTRIEDPQPPQANYDIGVRAICAKLKNVSLVSDRVSVPAGGSAELTVHCPRGTFAVGGGFRFSPLAADGTSPQRYLADGLLYASADGPPPGPSGRPLRDWHLTGRNQETAGLQYVDSVWIEHSSREELTGNGYFDSHARGADDQLLRGSTVPPAQQLTGSALCATVDGEPTRPGAAPTTSLPHPDLPPVLDLPPTTTTTTGPTPSPSPSIAPSPSPRPSSSSSRPPSPSPSASTSPSAQPQPQPPAVSIVQPSANGTLRRGCQEDFTATARSRPGDRPLTDPQSTLWQLTGPNGPTTLGSGLTGHFTVPLLPDGTYRLTFTATDPTNGLTTHTEIPIHITGCLR